MTTYNVTMSLLREIAEGMEEEEEEEEEEEKEEQEEDEEGEERRRRGRGEGSGSSAPMESIGGEKTGDEGEKRAYGGRRRETRNGGFCVKQTTKEETEAKNNKLPDLSVW